MTGLCDLDGRGVLVTRPAGQAEGLCRLIEAANGRPLAFPSIEIAPPARPDEARELLSQSWDLLVFISRNAVEQALALGPGGTWRRAAAIAAVGRATARALAEAGRTPDLVPADRFDTESLLALPPLADLSGRRVLIVRGEGGRTLLGEELLERGGEVHYAEVYRRVRPALDPGPLLHRWSRDVALMTATSDEVLLNLVEILGPEGRDRLARTPLVVISERTAEVARGLGIESVRVAARAEDEAILRALCDLVGPGRPD